MRLRACTWGAPGIPRRVTLGLPPCSAIFPRSPGIAPGSPRPVRSYNFPSTGFLIGGFSCRCCLPVVPVALMSHLCWRCSLLLAQCHNAQCLGPLLRHEYLSSALVGVQDIAVPAPASELPDPPPVGSFRAVQGKKEAVSGRATSQAGRVCVACLVPFLLQRVSMSIHALNSLLQDFPAPTGSPYGPVGAVGPASSQVWPGRGPAGQHPIWGLAGVSQDI